MKERINVQQLEPNSYKAMIGLENYLHSSGLSRKLIELIKIRASQINGCAYCLDMHTKDAMANGEEPRRLFAIAAWWESPLFNEKERAALKMTDEITRISEQGLSDEAYSIAKENFSDNEIAQIIIAIGVINVWNRIAVATHMVFEG
ncbi:MAG: carboxymuconolactone decarboxylase family protein [Proteiniphilum sp.]